MNICFLGSDLVTSLSRTLEKKLEGLRRSHEQSGTAFSSLSSSNNLDSQDDTEDGETEVFDDMKKTIIQEITLSTSHPPKAELEMPNSTSVKTTQVSKIATNGSAGKRGWRRNSMIERKVRRDSDSRQNGEYSVSALNEGGQADRGCFETHLNGVKFATSRV
jgi:hypothetical protein